MPVLAGAAEKEEAGSAVSHAVEKAHEAGMKGKDVAAAAHKASEAEKAKREADRQARKARIEAERKAAKAKKETEKKAKELKKETTKAQKKIEKQAKGMKKGY
jgi:septin family protein